MGLSNIVRSGIAIAKAVTLDLQDDCVHEAWISNNVHGEADYAAGVSRKGLVELKQTLTRQMSSAGGITSGSTETVVSPAKVTFMAPISSNGAEGRVEPFDPRDRITLPDGSIRPVVNVNGLEDPVTGHPYLYEVLLG